MNKSIAIIGGGPAGLIAAERLSAQGLRVRVYERKPTVARKFLMAGRGGLNITHSEDMESFLSKYGNRKDILAPMIRAFTPQDLRDWCAGLGQETFIGTSGRVFPQSFKASPLLRGWIARLEAQGVEILPHHEWTGWREDKLVFRVGEMEETIKADAILLALGGASWPRLGSDGSWVNILHESGITAAALEPSNCGFETGWSEIFIERFAGKPLKPASFTLDGRTIKGEAIITAKGIEGGAIYALSSALRGKITQNGHAEMTIDLKPDLGLDDMTDRLRRPRKGQSLSNFLRKNLKISDVAIGLIMERQDRALLAGYAPEILAGIIKAYPLKLMAPFSIERAISSAGGIRFEDLDDGLMLKNRPGVFVAGEMLDWEAPTGGYLLQACFASGIHAAASIRKYLQAVP